MTPTTRWIRRPILRLAILLSVAAIGCGSTARETLQQGPILDDASIAVINVTISPLSNLNSPFDDFGATMPLDTTYLYFTTGRDGRQRVVQSRWTGSGWGSPTPAPAIDNGKDNGLPCITPDGNTLYLAGDEYGFGDCDLYRVEVGLRGAVPTEQMPWTIPSNLGSNVNTLYWDSHPCVAADGSILYFSSDRAGGYGGRDIWYSRRRRDGSWDKPINAGEPINTPFDEISPWITPDNQSLLFSSNGHPGLGGFDVFVMTQTSGTRVVSNLGRPINSSSDDICCSMSADGKRVFLSSNRDGGPGGYDLYQITPSPVQIDPLTFVQGSVTGADGKSIAATIELTDLTSDVPLGRFMTDPETGLYRIVLPRGYNYALTAQAPGHLFSSEQVLVPSGLERDSSMRLDFRLREINGTIRLLVFFRPNESNLLKQSTSDLDRVVDFLRANDDITIELAGHTDNSGDPNEALELSLARARAVKAYLVGNRVLADRIRVVGYGVTQPIADNSTEEGRALNRRVEMRVVGGR